MSRESIKYIASKETKNFIEIGPGKVLSGLIKRIDRNLKVSAINSEEDISMLKNLPKGLLSKRMGVAVTPTLIASLYLLTIFNHVDAAI